jgi:hypothetical protein
LGTGRDYQLPEVREVVEDCQRLASQNYPKHPTRTRKNTSSQNAERSKKEKNAGAHLLSALCRMIFVRCFTACDASRKAPFAFLHVHFGFSIFGDWAKNN